MDNGVIERLLARKEVEAPRPQGGASRQGNLILYCAP